MIDENMEANFVEALRSKTEETDRKQYLKSILGGYTKNSVEEYLTALRKQQQTMTDTFSRNQQALFEEKEELKRINEGLKNRLRQIELEHYQLCQNIKGAQLSEEGASSTEVAAWKGKLSLLEEELDQSKLESSRLEKEKEQQEVLLQEASAKQEQAIQEKQAMWGMLQAQQEETKKQRLLASGLNAAVEDRERELQLLRSSLSEGEHARLKAKVIDLTGQLTTQTELLEHSQKEKDLRAQTIATLLQQKSALQRETDRLSQAVDEMKERNNQLLCTNQTLTDQLEEEYKRFLALLHDRSELVTGKLNAMKKLDSAAAYIADLELKLQRAVCKEREQAIPGLVAERNQQENELFPSVTA